jgi:methionyl-tRNA synthetase
MKKYYLTTTIPYVNAPPHLGHALEFVQADALVRWQRRRLGAENVYFLAGSDENAMKNVQAAEMAGMPVADFVDRNSAIFRDLLKALNISNDDFIRTTEERHMRGAQALWQATDPKDRYEKTYSGLYCTGCEQFYQPEELNENGECFEHPGKKLEMVEEKNWFFKLSNYQDWLKEIILSGELNIVPDTRRNEMLALIEQGLQDFSISRPVARTKQWGVPVPGDPGQTMYVWYDALANYITALGYPDAAGLYEKFWSSNEARGHILGKGVNRFHTIYWPAMLKSAGLPVPRFALVHGYVTVDGAKMSKSIGNVIDPMELIEEYGTDALRHYLLREIASQGDGDFSIARFKESYNAHLANGLGNLVSRVMKMAVTNEVRPELPEKEYLLEHPQVGLADNDKDMEAFALERVMNGIWAEVQNMDGMIQSTEPFKLIKTDPEKAKGIIAQLVQQLWIIGIALEPFLPETAEKIQATIREHRMPEPLFMRK